MIFKDNKQVQPIRNITPNFIRFKKEGPIKKNENSSDNKGSQKASSKNSRCSFEVYQKRILDFNQLKNTISARKKNLPQSKPPIDNHVETKRTTSNQQKQNGRQNIVLVNQNRLNPSFLSRKRSIGSGNMGKQERYPTPKRDQQSLEKEEQRAKLENNDLLNNLMKHQPVPNYMNKLKIKKEQNLTIKKAPNLILKQKKKFFQDQSIQLKGEQNLKNYQIYGDLGKGAYGIVKMALNKLSKQKVAIKIYDKSKLDEPNKIKNIQREIVILSKINNDTIAKLIQTIETAQQIYLILEYGGANSLYKYLLSKPQHRLDQKQAKIFFKIILTALNYLHQNHIVHRDIKAENILLNRHRQLKLIDFGFSLMSRPTEKIDTFCGTPTYMAPQIVSKRDHVPIYTDMWSLGVLYFVLLQGNYPFRAKNQLELFDKIKKGTFQYIHNDISEKSKQLIQGLLRIDPISRFTSNDLMQKQWISWYQEKNV